MNGFEGIGATPLGLMNQPTVSQGSSCLATLGWRTQSLRDCWREFIVLKGAPFEGLRFFLRRELQTQRRLAAGVETMNSVAMGFN